VTWTTELANAETAENAYRTAANGSFLNNYWRFDGRGGVLLTDWIRARAAASTVKVPASDARFWANVGMRAAVAMGPSWSVVTNQLQTTGGQTRLIIRTESADPQPFGFPGGTLDGAFGGLIAGWATSVWTTFGQPVGYVFSPEEDWTYLLANSLTIAGAA